MAPVLGFCVPGLDTGKPRDVSQGDQSATVSAGQARTERFGLRAKRTPSTSMKSGAMA